MSMPKGFKESLLRVGLRDRFDAFYGRMANDPALVRKGAGYADFHTQTHYAAFQAGYAARMEDEGRSPFIGVDPK